MSVFYTYNINEVRNNILPNGVASQNLYQIFFDISQNNILARVLSNAGFDIRNRDKFSAYNKLCLLCNSVTFPGMTTTTSNISSALPGYNIQFPIAASNHELSMTFIMDADMLPYKFFQTWLRTISPKVYDDTYTTPIAIKSRFYSEVVQNMQIYKFPDKSEDWNARKEGNGYAVRPKGTLASSDMIVTIIECYPINIGSVNFSYEPQSSYMTFNVSLAYRDYEFATKEFVSRFLDPTKEISFAPRRTSSNTSSQNRQSGGFSNPPPLNQGTSFTPVNLNIPSIGNSTLFESNLRIPSSGLSFTQLPPN